MDRYSGWPLVKPLRKLDTAAVTTVLEDWFLEHGKPVNLRSDGGPQFRQEFDRWCEQEKINHELSSAYHHQSNGHAEVAVREMKSLLAKTGSSFKEFRRALREWRNTPRFDGLSPAQWLTGYRQRTEAIAAPAAYQRISDTQLKFHESLRGQQYEKVMESQPSRNLEMLSPGQSVLVQDPKTNRWSLEATIVEKRSRHSYLVNIDGHRHLRNRRFIRPMVSDIVNRSKVTPNEAIDQGKYNTRQRKVTFQN